MDERKCKFCGQWKPVEEFPPDRKNRHVHTCRECEASTKPIQPQEFVKPALAHIRRPESNPAEAPAEAAPTCAHPGCPNPRHVKASGTFFTYCAEHQREYWRSKTREYYQQAKAVPKPAAPDQRVCKVCGVSKPLTDEYFPKQSGGLSKTCRTCHEQRPAPKRELTAAQKAVGFDSAPDLPGKRSKIKLCIVDHVTDRMLFVEGVVTQDCETHADQLLPGGFDLLLDLHAEEGYRVFQRGTPPTISVRYDWSD